MLPGCYFMLHKGDECGQVGGCCLPGLTCGTSGRCVWAKETWAFSPNCTNKLASGADCGAHWGVGQGRRLQCMPGALDRGAHSGSPWGCWIAVPTAVRTGALDNCRLWFALGRSIATHTVVRTGTFGWARWMSTQDFAPGMLDGGADLDGLL